MRICMRKADAEEFGCSRSRWSDFFHGCVSCESGEVDEERVDFWWWRYRLCSSDIAVSIIICEWVIAPWTRYGGVCVRGRWTGAISASELRVTEY